MQDLQDLQDSPASIFASQTRFLGPATPAAAAKIAKMPTAALRTGVVSWTH